MPIITEKVIARNTYDTIRVYDIEHDIEDIIVYSSWQTNHCHKERATIEYAPHLEDLAFFTDGCDESTEVIHLNELIRE